MTTLDGGWTLIGKKTSANYNQWTGTYNAACHTHTTIDGRSPILWSIAWDEVMWRFSGDTQHSTTWDSTA